MTGRTITLALALALALLWAAPARAFQIGIQDDKAFVSAPPEGRAVAYTHARAMGASYLRITLVWEAFRNQGFAPYDFAVNDARRQGWTVHLTITGNPQWTRRGSGWIGYLRPKPSRFGAWAGRVARHFRGRVQLYSVWNEPNLENYLAPQIVGRRAVGHLIYRSLFRAAYRAIKRADRRAKVLIGEAAPSGQPVRFLVRTAGRGLVADGWAHHSYQFVRTPPSRPQRRYSGGISNLGVMKSTLRRLARQRRLRTPAGKPLPIYFTEFAYPRRGAYYGYLSETLRAAYTLQAFRMAKRAGVRAMVWYQLYTNPGPVHPKLWDTGLLGHDGEQSLLYRQLVANRRSLAGF